MTLCAVALPATLAQAAINVAIALDGAYIGSGHLGHYVGVIGAATLSLARHVAIAGPAQGYQVAAGPVSATVRLRGARCAPVALSGVQGLFSLLVVYRGSRQPLPRRLAAVAMHAVRAGRAGLTSAWLALAVFSCVCAPRATCGACARCGATCCTSRAVASSQKDRVVSNRKKT